MSELFDQARLPQPPHHTERLILRPYEIEDADQAHELLDRDPEVWEFDPGYAPSPEDRLTKIARYDCLRRQFGFGPVAAFLRSHDGSEGHLIGQGGLNPYIYDHPNGDRSVEFEVMFKLGRRYWDKGYAIEIASFWVDYAFKHVKLPRLCIGPEKANARSVQLLDRLGAEILPDWLDEGSVIAIIAKPEN